MPERLELYNHDCHIFVIPSLLVFDYLRVHLALNGMTDFFLQREIKRESYIQSYIRSAKMPALHIQIGLNYEPVHPPPPPPTPKKGGGGSCFILLNNFISVFCQTK